MTEIIPLTNTPEQLLQVRIDGAVYDLRVIYNARWGVWTLSISQNGSLLLAGTPLVGGMELIGQHALDISGLYAINLTDPDLDATFENFGEAVKLVHTDEPPI